MLDASWSPRSGSRPAPIVPEEPPAGRAPGWREVVLVAVAVLGAVLGLEILTAVVPGARDLFEGFPVVIVGLVVATAGILLAMTLRRPRR